MATRKNSGRILGIVWLACAVAAFSVCAPSTQAQGSAREITVRADQFAFSPGRIDLQKDDIVKVTFTAVDMPHSVTIDGYRISKRAAAGQTVTFEFRADKTGTFPFFCNLTQDDRCRQMHGEMIVR
ncbi:MAG TPA: cupredoxin domain-containing protein [Vicinamibacterales bacterium]|nr:cupredoxin domain-containing protein [Vicinamibacterales bacterium]